MRIRLATLAFLFATPLSAQDPLSVIEWLSRPPEAGGAGPVLSEPPTAKTALQPQIDVAPLDAAQRAIGLVPGSRTGLPDDLWLGDNIDRTTRLIRDVAVNRSPAMQTLLYSLLLTEARSPQDMADAEALLLARVERLMRLGAVDPAQALIEDAGPQASPARFDLWLDATLLSGDEDRACGALNAKPALSEDYAARIFCRMRAGDYSAAVLQFDGARALDLLRPSQIALLDRFLHPDLYEDAAPLPAPSQPDPLTFRLHETIGEPLSTASLPRAFAHADLRDLAGWKAQLEAAERLARSRAISPNQLLGLYGARQPAASGGIWDRVAAVQRFETALSTGSGDAVSKTLPLAWQAMQSAELEIVFASLFGAALADRSGLDDEAQRLAWQIGLLSDRLPDEASNPPIDLAQAPVLAGFVTGQPTAEDAVLSQALADGFNGEAMPGPELQREIEALGLGTVILDAMADFHTGASGNLDALSTSLQTLRALGLQDTARDAALQLLLLGRG